KLPKNTFLELIDKIADKLPGWKLLIKFGGASCGKVIALLDGQEYIPMILFLGYSCGMHLPTSASSCNMFMMMG
ncbi:hypothetical protein ACJX0J_010007, partial [Zea mays]